MMKESTWNGLELRRSEISVEKRGTNKSKSSVGAAQFYTFTIFITPFHGRLYGNLLEGENYRNLLFFFRTFVLIQKYQKIKAKRNPPALPSS